MGAKRGAEAQDPTASTADWERQERSLVTVPPGALALKDIPLPPALEKACAGFEDAVGGREALVSHFAYAELGPREQLLIGAVADPRNDQHSLARICQLNGLQFTTLLGMFRQAGFARAQVEAMQRIWKVVPELAEDVMARSLPHELPCETCCGDGKRTEKKFTKGDDGKAVEAEVSVECPTCRGRGKQLHQPDLDRQKLGLQLAGLLPGAAGAQVNINVDKSTKQQFNLNAGGDVFASFMAASDQVLYPARGGAGAGAGDSKFEEVVDAEPVGEPVEETVEASADLGGGSLDDDEVEAEEIIRQAEENR